VIYKEIVRLSKSRDKESKTLELINKIFKEILKNNLNYCGSVTVNFYMGGITNIEKKEIVKTN